MFNEIKNKNGGKNIIFGLQKKKYPIKKYPEHENNKQNQKPFHYISLLEIPQPSMEQKNSKKKRKNQFVIKDGSHT